MTTTLDNSQRVFLIQERNEDGHYGFCNLEYLSEFLSKFENPVIKHFWNGKFEVISKKLLQDMLSLINGKEF